MTPEIIGSAVKIVDRKALERVIFDAKTEPDVTCAIAQESIEVFDCDRQ